ncbi:MAG TPA: protein translocase subunit SecF [Patescibacteria group bacterium]|nr:protein translocase subunit SecF [Patescibacteria group bacterium]
MQIIQRRKTWFAISGTMVAISIILLATLGLKLNIDFTGGSLLEVEYTEERVDIAEIRQSVEEAGFVEGSVQPTDERGLLVRQVTLSEDRHQELLSVLKTHGELEEMRFDSIGPVIGEELQRKSFVALGLIFLSIILYVAFAFRKVSRYIKSWKYGVLTIVAALHDIFIPLGVFALLGHFTGATVGTAFVAALLTILGYSVNDSIVVFDRVRENLIADGDSHFEDTVNKSVTQTIARSINTTVTTLLALVAIYIFGGETVKDFVLVLIIGIGVGAYSSVFLASPLLVTWRNWENK